jgi:hypothetical protein
MVRFNDAVAFDGPLNAIQLGFRASVSQIRSGGDEMAAIEIDHSANPGLAVFGPKIVMKKITGIRCETQG